MTTAYDQDLVTAAGLLGQAHRLAGFSVTDADAIRQLDQAELPAGSPLRDAMVDAYREATDE